MQKACSTLSWFAMSCMWTHRVIWFPSVLANIITFLFQRLLAIYVIWLYVKVDTMYYHDIEVSVQHFFPSRILFLLLLVLLSLWLLRWMKSKLCRKENDIETGTISHWCDFFCATVSARDQNHGNVNTKAKLWVKFFFLSPLFIPQRLVFV